MAERVPIREGTFQEGPDGGVLLANKCKSCGQIFFPKAKLCQACLHEELEEAPLSRKGKLYSYTIAHMPSSFFPPPHAMGYVAFPEGVRVFAPLKIIEDKFSDIAHFEKEPSRQGRMISMIMGPRSDRKAKKGGGEGDAKDQDK